MKHLSVFFVFVVTVLLVLSLASCGDTADAETPKTEAPPVTDGGEPSPTPDPPAPVIYQITIYDETGKWLQNVETADGGAYTLTAPERAGYAFAGWVNKADHTEFAASGTLSASCDIVAEFTLSETTTFDELKARVEAGAKEIYITEDIVLTDAIYVVSDTTIYTNQSVTLTRSPSYLGDLFIVGETPDGRNVVEIYGQGARLTLRGDESVMTIDGNKANITDTVKGTAFLILNSSTVSLGEGVTVQNCRKLGNEKVYQSVVSYPHKAGGAAVMVLNGTLNISGAVLCDNEVSGEDAVEGNTELGISSCGGAIFNFGTVNMTAGTLSGNTAARGGAVYNFRDCVVKGGIITDNAAQIYGGAVYLANSQYGEFKIGVTVTEPLPADAYAVVFSSNTSEKSGGAIFAQTKNGIVIYGSTLFDGNVSATANGGAINSSSSLTVKDATFRNNIAASKGGAVYIYCASQELTARQATIEKGLFENNRASKGGALACSASSTEFTKGAIGFIGAVTFKNNTAYTTTTADPELPDEESGNGTVFNGKGGAVYLSRRGDLTITGATFIGNVAEDNGGAVYATSNSHLKVSDSAFTFNSATGDKGGALYVTTETTATVGSCTFTENTAAKFGGAVSVHSVGTTLTIEASLFDSNRTLGSHGGAISIFSGSHVTVSTTEFKKNAAMHNVYDTDNVTVLETTGKGGAIHVQGDPDSSVSSYLTLTDCTFAENVAGEHGGAVNLYESADLTITGGSMRENTAGVNGGAVYSSGSALTVTGTSFVQNQADGKGGVLYLTTSTGTLENVTFENNTSLDNGGVMNASSSSVVAINGMTATGNHSKNGGVFYFTGEAQVDLYAISAVNNTATKGGFLYITTTGTVVNLHSKAIVTDGDAISGNTATGGGNLIWSNTTKATINANFTNLPELLFDTDTDADGVDAMGDGYTDDIGSKDNKKITIGDLSNA